MLGQQRKSPSNEHKTEFASPLLLGLEITLYVQHGNHRAWWNLQQKSLNLKLTRFYFLSVLICQPWSLAAAFGRKSKETKTQRGRCANYFHASYTKKSSEKEFTSQGEFPSFCLSTRQKTWNLRCGSMWVNCLTKPGKCHFLRACGKITLQYWHTSALVVFVD